MMLEYDIRMSLKPISTATLSSAPWMTLAVMGSMRLRRRDRALRAAPSPFALRGARLVVITLLPPSNEIAAFVRHDGTAGRNHCRAVDFDHRLCQQLAVVKRSNSRNCGPVSMTQNRLAQDGEAEQNRKCVPLPENIGRQWGVSLPTCANRISSSVRDGRFDEALPLRVLEPIAAAGPCPYKALVEQDDSIAERAQSTETFQLAQNCRCCLSTTPNRERENIVRQRQLVVPSPI
jgi:hypothetical protein